MAHQSRKLAVTAAAALLASSLFAGAPASAASYSEQVADVLQAHNVPQSDVASVQIVSRSRGGKAASNYHKEAWVALNGCDGHLVITMARPGNMMTAYTTGGCSVAELPHY